MHHLRPLLFGLALWATGAHGCVGPSNNRAEGAEVCDGTDLKAATCLTAGFAGGLLRCTAACIYDTSGCVRCVGGTPNNQLDGQEACDGPNLRGQTCITLGFPQGGTLTCANCQFVTTACQGVRGPTVPTPATGGPVIPTPANALSIVPPDDSDDNLPLILGITGGVGLLCSLLICSAGALGLLYAFSVSKRETRGRWGDRGVAGASLDMAPRENTPCGAAVLGGLEEAPPGLPIPEYHTGANQDPLDECEDFTAYPVPVEIE